MAMFTAACNTAFKKESDRKAKQLKQQLQNNPD